MHVSQTIFLTALLCTAAYGQANTTEGAVTTGASVSTAAAGPTSATNTDSPIAATTIEEVLSCFTTWHLPGQCVLRLLCDNNTPAIDLTPYSLRGAKRVCPKGHTCCPPDLILTPSTEPPPHKASHQFDFDDDD